MVVSDLALVACTSLFILRKHSPVYQNANSVITLEQHCHLEVGGCYWIAGAVRVCESIQKGVQRPFHQLNKGLLDWILLAATQNTVFQDVRDAFAVFYWSPEDCPKGLVLILVEQRHDLSSCTSRVLQGVCHICIAGWVATAMAHACSHHACCF